MQHIFWVEKGNLTEVNKFLQRGGKVKSITPVAENIAAYGYAGGESYNNSYGEYIGNIYAYIVVEFD